MTITGNWRVRAFINWLPRNSVSGIINMVEVPFVVAAC